MFISVCLLVAAAFGVLPETSYLFRVFRVLSGSLLSLLMNTVMVSHLTLTLFSP